MFPLIALFLYLILSLVTFAAYGYDKSAARQGGWRTPERTLLLLSLAGGAAGGLLGMVLFHHKTRKMLFWTVNLFASGLHLYLIGLLTRMRL